MQILIYKDGRPGHEKQTDGIVKALADLQDITIETIYIKPTFLNDILAVLSLLMSCFYFNKKSAFQLVIGTGSHTHFHILAAGRKYNAKTVTCMSPAPYLVRFFDLCFVPEHDIITPYDNIIKTTGPPNACTDQNLHKKDNGLILLGGICEYHRWDSSGITQKVIEIVEADKDIKWSISSSPRTPADIIRDIENFTANQQNAKFYNYQDTAPGWVEEKYNESEKVWVTADSVSMVYEALSSGCMVGIIPVIRKKENDKFARGLKHLYSNNLVAKYSNWQQTQTFPKIKNKINEAKRCARIIIERLFTTVP